MLMLSACDSFWSSTEVSDEQMQLALVNRNGDTTPVDPSPKWFEGKKVLVVVHGFNSTIDEIIHFFFHIKDHLQNPESLYHFVIGYVWPGHNHRLLYQCARLNVGLCKERFQKNVRQLFKGNTPDVLGNSMGSRLVCEALKTAQSKLLNDFFLWAPAINADDFEKEGEYEGVNTKCNHLFVYFSHRDSLLRFGYPLAELSMKSAMGYSGTAHVESLPENIKVVDATEIVSSHADYRFLGNVASTINKVAAVAQHCTLQKNGDIVPYQGRPTPHLINDFKTRLALLISFNKIARFVEFILKIQWRLHLQSR